VQARVHVTTELEEIRGRGCRERPNDKAAAQLERSLCKQRPKPSFDLIARNGGPNRFADDYSNTGRRRGIGSHSDTDQGRRAPSATAQNGREVTAGPEPASPWQHEERRLTQAASRLRPLRRRPARIARPARVRIRSRNPWVFARRRLLGWNVRFVTASCSHTQTGKDPAPRKNRLVLLIVARRSELDTCKRISGASLRAPIATSKPAAANVRVCSDRGQT
jgi:hypothetical protein